MLVKAIVVEVGKEPYVREINFGEPKDSWDNSYKEALEIIGSRELEIMWPDRSGVEILLGHGRKGKKLNRTVKTDFGGGLQKIYGTFIVCGMKAGIGTYEDVSLTEEQIAKYMEMLKLN